MSIKKSVQAWGDVEGQLAICADGSIHSATVECGQCGIMIKMCPFCHGKVRLKGWLIPAHDRDGIVRCPGSGRRWGEVNARK